MTQLLTRGLALACEGGDRYFCAQILLKLGLRALDRADYKPAHTLLEESVALARELGAVCVDGRWLRRCAGSH